MSEYKLYYFNARGVGDYARQILSMADVKFEDIRYSHEQWAEHKHEMPFGQMPLLKVDGVEIPQSMAITRYLARKYGYAGKTAEEQALVDAFADQYKDFYAEIKDYFYPAIGIFPADAATVAEKKEKILIPARNKYFGLLTNYLKKSTTGFLAGGELTFADLILAEHVFTMLSIVPEYVDDFSEIAAHLKKTHAVPELKKWLDTRPVTPY